MARIALVKCEAVRRDTPLSPCLGVLYLASALRQERHEVRVWDLRFAPRETPRVIEEIRSFRPDLIGLSGLTCEAPSLHRFAGRLREVFPAAHIVAGGPHASAYPEAVLADANIDAAVRGEGERTFPELAAVLLAGGDCSGVKGIGFRSGAGVVLTEPREPIGDLDLIPRPAWELIDLGRYREYYRNTEMGRPGSRYAVIMTSRSCPYRCAYCHNLFGKGFRARSPEHVIGEMEYLYRDHGVTDFEIVDDIFNFDQDRAADICRLILRKGLPVRLSFPNGIRADVMPRGLLALMRRAGTYYLAVGVETAVPRLQRLVRKHLDLEKVRRTIEDAVDLGIYTMGFFMLGFPTETREDVLRTIRFARESRLHAAHFHLLTPFRGTDLYREYRDHIRPARVPYGTYDYFEGYFNLSEMEDRELLRLQRRANRMFYLKAGRLWRIARSYPDRRNVFHAGRVLLRRSLARRYLDPADGQDCVDQV